ncbi:MAG: aldolase/citrate lyase family protein [Proteobacteria bacterium]|nr:aldolase/citrate lyase family protein [Pseudomonadota bacterium]MDA1331640.1 aldolase/citrate lyase family protein [Pseudomonadota bacterium]
MRDNIIKKKVLAGEPVFGTFGWEFLVPGLPQIVKSSGADFLLIDMEHSGVSYETLKTQIALCRGLDLVPMCRIPSNQYHYISRALDLGALGIMAPMVGSAQEAEFIVSCTQYPPKGRRGAAFGFASDDYLGGNVSEKIEIANQRTLVMALIETKDGIENINEIAAVPGIDVLWLGHFDLTNFLGIPGEFSNPKYLDAVERLRDAARRYGKVLACMSANDEWSREYWLKDFRLFAVGVDSTLLQSALKAGIDVLRDLSDK